MGWRKASCEEGRQGLGNERGKVTGKKGGY